MRTEKFDNSKSAYETDDIKYAFECNGLKNELDNIDMIVAEVCGENDGNDWYWILQMKDGTFANASGGCDYTGWDCQSYAYINKGFKTAEEAIDELSLKESYDTRPQDQIKKVLHAQIQGKVPFALYDENYGGQN